jgi:hypothetical protein
MLNIITKVTWSGVILSFLLCSTRSFTVDANKTHGWAIKPKGNWKVGQITKMEKKKAKEIRVSFKRAKEKISSLI